MDFSLQYTPEQEEFALKVRRWLDDNVPPDLQREGDPMTVSYAQWSMRRELGRKLGEKGWLYPATPVEYGGGAMGGDLGAVLHIELAERGLGLPPYYTTSMLAIPAILAFGTEEQKRRFLPPILRDGAVVWQLFTEPEAGTDEANQQASALRHTRDKDHFVVSGQKIFVGSLHPPKPEYLWLLTRSDPRGPRHRNLAMFLCPADLPGITIAPLDLFPSHLLDRVAGQTPLASPGVKQTVFLDEVRIHESHLIGGETDGWKVTAATLAVEHGEVGRDASGRGARWIGRNLLVEKFLAQCRQNPRVAARLRENPQLMDRVVRVHTIAETLRLFATRNAAGRGGRYGGPQLQLQTKTLGPLLLAEMAEVLGPYAFTDDPAWRLDGGVFEVCARSCLCMAPAGTPEALKIIISRALALGR